MKTQSHFVNPVVLAVALPALFGTLSACSSGNGPSPAAPTAPGSSAAPANVIVDPAPAAPATAATVAAAPAAPAVEPPVVVKDVGFKTPESVLYDPEQDVYFVSNIDGKPVDADGNGFISKVGPDGKVIDLKWIESKKKGVTLDAPKGLTVSGDTLYVADLTVVRMFDRKTGAQKGKVACPGSTFLNDVAVGPDGTVYVTDSGLKLGKDGLEPNGSDAIYKIGKSKKGEKLIAGKELGGPNGILADDKGVTVVTFGSSALYRVGLDGKKEPDQAFSVKALDGLVKLSDGTFLVSSWGASAVLRGTPGGPFSPVINDAKSPADIGYDTKRSVVLIPLFTLDAIELAKLPNPPPAAAEPAPAPAAQKSEPAAQAVAKNEPAAPGAKAAAPKSEPAAPAAAKPAAPAPVAAATPAMTPGKPAAAFPAPAATPAAAPAPAAAAAPAKK